MTHQLITALILLLCVVSTFETISQLGTPKKTAYMLATGILWVLFYLLATGAI